MIFSEITRAISNFNFYDFIERRLEKRIEPTVKHIKYRFIGTIYSINIGNGSKKSAGAKDNNSGKGDIDKWYGQPNEESRVTCSLEPTFRWWVLCGLFSFLACLPLYVHVKPSFVFFLALYLVLIIASLFIIYIMFMLEKNHRAYKSIRKKSTWNKHPIYKVISIYRSLLPFGMVVFGVFFALLIFGVSTPSTEIAADIKNERIILKKCNSYVFSGSAASEFCEFIETGGVQDDTNYFLLIICNLVIFFLVSGFAVFLTKKRRSQFWLERYFAVEQLSSSKQYVVTLTKLNNDCHPWIWMTKHDISQHIYMRSLRASFFRKDNFDRVNPVSPSLLLIFFAPISIPYLVFFMTFVINRALGVLYEEIVVFLMAALWVGVSMSWYTFTGNWLINNKWYYDGGLKKSKVKNFLFSDKDAFKGFASDVNSVFERKGVAAFSLLFFSFIPILYRVGLS